MYLFYSLPKTINIVECLQKTNLHAHSCNLGVVFINYPEYFDTEDAVAERKIRNINLHHSFKGN